MVKVRITSKGIIQEPGEGTDLGSGLLTIDNANHTGVLPFKQTVQAKTADFTVTNANAGVMTISGSLVITGTMPAAADAAGAIFTFRNLSAGHEHTLTGSDAGVEMFSERINSIGAGGTSAITGSKGSRLRLDTIVGSSVTLLSDGVNYLILGRSGSITLDQA